MSTSHAAHGRAQVSEKQFVALHPPHILVVCKVKHVPQTSLMSSSSDDEEEEGMGLAGRPSTSHLAFQAVILSFALFRVVEGRR